MKFKFLFNASFIVSAFWMICNFLNPGNSPLETAGKIEAAPGDSVLFIQEVRMDSGEINCLRRMRDGIPILSDIKVIDKDSKSLIIRLSDLNQRARILPSDHFYPGNAFSWPVQFYLPDSIASKNIEFIPVFQCRTGSGTQSLYHKDGDIFEPVSDFLTINSTPEKAKFVILAKFYWRGKEEKYRQKMMRYLQGDEHAFNPKEDKILVKDITSMSAKFEKGKYVILFGLEGYDVKEEYYDNMGPVVKKDVNPVLSKLPEVKKD